MGELRGELSERRKNQAVTIISPDAVENGTLEELLQKSKQPLRTNVNGAVRGRHRQSINESLRDTSEVVGSDHLL